MVENARKYAKFIVALLVALGITVSALADDRLTDAELTAITIAVLGAFGVRQIPNDPM